MALSYSLDIEAFIQEIHKYPVLWHLNDPYFRSRSKKDRAWAKIANVFIPDFGTMDEEEKNDVFHKLSSKWRNVRDAYVRNIRRGGEGKRQYCYAEHLSFLDECYRPENKLEDQEEWLDDVAPKKRKRPKVEIIAKPPTDWSSEDEQLQDISKKINNNPEFLEVANEQTSFLGNADDEDRYFFESLLPTVKDLDTDQKLEFRSQVLMLLKQVRSNSTKEQRRDNESD